MFVIHHTFSPLVDANAKEKKRKKKKSHCATTTVPAFPRRPADGVGDNESRLHSDLAFNRKLYSPLPSIITQSSSFFGFSYLVVKLNDRPVLNGLVYLDMLVREQFPNFVNREHQLFCSELRNANPSHQLKIPSYFFFPIPPYLIAITIRRSFRLWFLSLLFLVWN